ncbi:MAG: phosphate ABC transporter substrate-binding protein [Gammaproteobacteria bacterium]|nr:phosphate ABC transporter substrate-binding protein [Gammaproteobacteria bacterium]
MRHFFFNCLFLLSIIFPYNSFADAKNLNWSGCGISKKAYMTDLAKAYETKKGVSINLQGGGATKGIRQVADNTTDIGGACRYYLPGNKVEESVAFEPVAWDALVVIVNKNNPVEDISFQQVHDLYSGKITNWKQLGGKDAPIKLFTRQGKISGVGYTIRKLIFANPEKTFARSTEFKSSGPLEKAILEDELAIGITGISSARLRDLKILTLDGKAPDYLSIRRGNYSLYRPLFLTYNPLSKDVDTIKDFINFAHSSIGRKIMKKNGVVPYLEALVLVMKQVQQDQLAQKTSANDYTSN